ncbi:MAG TPA: hypothetical protein VM282_04075 [Acidimicrobiales bacterium]|nr:hypothetical protein [Acidimicrobiales bacterium]
MFADDRTYTRDAQRMEAERIARGEPSYADDLARIKANVDPEATRLHRELSELGELSPVEDEGAPLISLDSLFSPSGWPLIRCEAFQGPIGEFALAAAPFTEADPIAILAQCLVGFGVAANSGAYMLAGNDRHPAALNAAIVGETAKAGKGTSKSAAFGLMALVDPALMSSQLPRDSAAAKR